MIYFIKSIQIPDNWFCIIKQEPNKEDIEICRCTNIADANKITDLLQLQYFTIKKLYKFYTHRKSDKRTYIGKEYYNNDFEAIREIRNLYIQVDEIICIEGNTENTIWTTALGQVIIIDPSWPN